MIFQKIKVGTSVIPLYRVILTGESISYIIFMIQGHPQGESQFLGNNARNTCTSSFHGLLTFEKSIHSIILVIEGHLQGYLQGQFQGQRYKKNDF